MIAGNVADYSTLGVNGYASATHPAQQHRRAPRTLRHNRDVEPPKVVRASKPVQVAGIVKLYTWWRSQASFRVRIALLLKGLEAQMIFVDLLQGHQLAESYRSLNPEMVLPTLIDGDGPPLVQSLAILEYLDERSPEPALLPKDVRARAYVRALAQSVAVDAHPFVVPRVRKYLEQELGVDESRRMKWIRHWLDSGTRVLEEQLARDPRTGRFCYGDAPTIADICLAPHITSAKMLYDCDLSPYPTVRRIFETCMELDAFAKAHPIQQADAAKAGG